MYLIFSKTGVFTLFYFLNRNKKIVLTYHNVIPDQLFDDSPHLDVSHHKSIFEHHIQHIKKRFSKNDLANRVLLTFDDGYQNQFKIASKILDTHQLSGIFFLSFKLIEEEKTLDVDNMTQWVSYVPPGNYTLFQQPVTVTTENRAEIASTIYDWLLSDYLLWNTLERELNNAYPFDRLAIPNALKTLRFDPIKPNELCLMIANGHRIAAHSWNHYPLATLPIALQRHDFELCQLKKKKYCNSDLYSYPFGGLAEVSEAAINLCADYGFSEAYINDENPLNWPDSDSRYQLPRISLPNHNNSVILDAKLSGFEFFCKKWIRKLAWKKANAQHG